MNRPLVSIVVPCHNRAHLLSQTMESIFAQSYQPVEILVIDDGSTDETPKLMETYGDKIRYVRQENQGVGQHHRRDRADAGNFQVALAVHHHQREVRHQRRDDIGG